MILIHDFVANKLYRMWYSGKERWERIDVCPVPKTVWAQVELFPVVPDMLVGNWEPVAGIPSEKDHLDVYYNDALHHTWYRKSAKCNTWHAAKADTAIVCSDGHHYHHQQIPEDNWFPVRFVPQELTILECIKRGMLSE